MRFNLSPNAIACLVLAVVLGVLSAEGQIIYDNGTLDTGPITRSGVTAPAGNTWSEVQSNYGDAATSNTSAGATCAQSLFRLADDFIVPVGQTWTINEVITFAYLTGGATVPPSPFTSGVLQIWNGRPGDPGSTVIFGDTTTNRLTASADSTLFRIFNTTAPPPGTAPGTTRKIWRNTLSVSPPLVLTAGQYWIDWGTVVNATPGTSHFCPGNTIVGIRATPMMNARQVTVSTGVWTDAVDAGNPAASPDYRLDFPFKLVGSKSGVPLAPASRKIDFDGDNRADFAVARSAGVAAQSTWWIQYAAGSTAAYSWGLGVGIPGGDRAAPADFDGDGKTDIAVWRPAAALTAAFYILNSATNTVRVDVFGQTGDDSSVVGDYDGDGKADVAVYRSGANGVLYYRGSLNNPGNNITFRPWGTTGDVALPGDFDGDGRYDVAVYRNNAGSAEHWQSLSGGGFRVLQYGLFADRFVTGDFDGDSRTDVAAVRDNGGVFDWYILRSSDSVVVLDKFGASATDYLVPGDFDGDSKTDLAIWRSGLGADAGFFFVRNSFGSPVGIKLGQSAGALTAPDYPVGNFSVK